MDTSRPNPAAETRTRGVSDNRAGRALRAMLRGLYGLYAWVVFGAMAAAAWLGVSLSRKRQTAWCRARRAARLALRLTGTRLRIVGASALVGGPRCVLIANHDSLVDAIALLAALPMPVSFVAKAELMRRRALRRTLRRLEVQPVQRGDGRRPTAATERLSARVRQGHSVLFFPEGHIGPAGSLSPLRMGAFVVASRTGVPIIPIAVRGARAKLPPGRWWPRPGSIELEVGEPLWSQGTDWDAALQLRQTSHTWLAAHTGD